MSSLTPRELDALNTVLDVVVLAGATSDLAPYITDKAEGFLAALAGVDPPLTVVPLAATPPQPSAGLRAALERYGKHDYGCASTKSDEGLDVWAVVECTCPQATLYGAHDLGCPRSLAFIEWRKAEDSKPRPECTCGFDAALAAKPDAPEDDEPEAPWADAAMWAYQFTGALSTAYDFEDDDIVPLLDLLSALAESRIPSVEWPAVVPSIAANRRGPFAAKPDAGEGLDNVIAPDSMAVSRMNEAMKSVAASVQDLTDATNRGLRATTDETGGGE